MTEILKSKMLQFATVLFLATCIIATGSYAWGSFISQSTLYTPHIAPADVVLVDFSDQLGEIYVVNSSRHEVIVRVKFLQYLAIGGTSVIGGAIDDDPSTWPVSSPAITKHYRPVYSRAVVRMADWKRQGAPMGDFWIADSDGWYYYARTLFPGEATRTLITEISTNQFHELVGDDYKTATFLQAAGRGKIADLLVLDPSGFTSDGRLTMQYLNGDIPAIGAM